MSDRWFVDSSTTWTAVLGLQWAAIEGTPEEMGRVAGALASGEAYLMARRAAVVWDGEHALVWSPRNSTERSRLDRTQARKLSEEILLSISNGQA